jgi:transposase InsO family protein
MPWMETEPVKERTKFVLEWEKRWQQMQGRRVDFAELCRVFGISRQTGYRWLKRYQDAGRDVRALETRSSRPRHSPTSTSEQVQDVIVAVRKAHPRWGPRKLYAWLRERNPGRVIPSPSTIGLVLQRRGMTAPHRGRRRRHVPPATQPFAEATAPNALWCIDFKGKFRTADGEWCTPFTVTDAFSRYCIRCEVVEEAGSRDVERILDSAFREFGLPTAIRSDNGPPFAAPGPAGLTQLAVWLLRLGIRLERIQPGKPQQNGRHERFHRTLEEAISPPRSNRRTQQRAFDLFRREFNEDRPHEALGQRPPGTCYRPSSRRYPGARIDVHHDALNHVERVERDGTIRFGRRRLFISTALRGEFVECEPLPGSRWEVRFGPIVLGHFDAERPPRLLPAPRPRKSHFLELSPGSSD